MRESCNIAFKEWAAVCEALADGRQTIILRKGGIHEGREGFRVEHRQFWLYPTKFHQAAAGLTADAGEFIARALAGTKPGPGELPTNLIRVFANVEEVHELQSESAAQCLAGLHIWSEVTVRERFAYRQPGLFLLVVRVFVRDPPVLVPETAEMAGCKSWVTLPEPIAIDGLSPVLSDSEFVARREQILAAVA
jgi:hypothetical protein